MASQKDTQVIRFSWPTLSGYVVNAFITFYMFGLAATICPLEPLQRRIGALTAPVWNALGLWQNWVLFAPGVRATNLEIIAVVTLQGGYWLTENLPPNSDTLRNKVKHWKLRQLVQETAASNAIIWPEIARYVARQHSGFDDSKPLLVTLFVRESKLRGAKLPDLVSRNPINNLKAFYVYQVVDEDLE